MNKGNRKHILPLALVMSLAVVGMMAAFIALAVQPGTVAAQTDPLCDGPLAPLLPQCQTGTPTPDPDPGTTETPPQIDPTDPMAAAGDNVDSSSTTASASPELKLTIANVGTAGLPVGSSVVLYLEDQFQAPDSIPMTSAYFVATGGDTSTTGNGSRVYVTSPVKLKTDGYFDQDKSDIAIRVLIPDMCTDATDDCEGPNGVMANQRLQLVLESDSGIKNPSEADKQVDVGYAILGPTDDIPGRGKFVSSRDADDDTLDALKIYAKITLSDVDNSRGYEMTVTGTGFNNGTTAGVYVLHIPGTEPGNAMRNENLWNALDCGEMNAAFGLMGDDAEPMGTSPCTMYDGLSDTHEAAVDMDGFFSSGYGEAQLCAAIVRSGTEVGGALVGSDDKVNVTFEVTAPTFGPGQTNHICMVDGEGLGSITDVEDFKLEPSIKVVPSSANSGDTVNVFAQDYPSSAGSFNRLLLAGQDITHVVASRNRGSIANDGSGEISFDVPGGFEGVLRIDARWGTVNEDAKITLAGAQLNASKTDVLPNETITITGNGFGTGQGTCIPVANIKLEDVAVMVDDESKANSGACSGMVEVSNSGQFVATLILWPDDEDDSNPTLIPGVHRLSVEDNKEYSSEVDITIAEPTVTVTPDVAGPRDYITITGTNWPVDNPENPSSIGIIVEVADTSARARQYTLFADAVGRITQEHRVHRNVNIPSTVQVKMTYGDVAKIGSFAVPASTIEVSPGEGQPGDMITLTASNMKVYTQVDYVEIGGTRNDDPGVNTDRDGNVTVENVLIPGLDPGVYSVVINIDDTIAIGEVKVLAESSAAGAPAELPGAVESLGDNLVAIFHFDDVGKTWSFYDPRPEFADLNTLTEMVNGEAYWILVSETVEDVVLNNKVRSLTCRGDDCWNLEVW